MGLVCIQNSSLLVYSKSQKVSASYCLPFQHSRGKNQPVGGFRPPPACLGLSLDKALQICRASEEVKLQTQEIQGASGGTTNTKVNFVNSKHKYRPQESSAHRPKSTMS